jgi:hypothetical protein
MDGLYHNMRCEHPNGDLHAVINVIKIYLGGCIVNQSTSADHRLTQSHTLGCSQ